MARILDPDEKAEPPRVREQAVALIGSAVAVGATMAGHALGDPVGWAIFGAAGQHLVRTVLAPITMTGFADFVNELATRIQRLEEAGRISMEELPNNPRFREAVGLATRIASFTTREEKRRALRNAVLNSALSKDMDALEQEIFFGLIERFTELHLLMLQLLKDPERWRGRTGAPFGRHMNSVLRSVLVDGLPQLQTHPFLADQVWNELRSTNLVTGAESLDNAGEGPSITKKRTTEFGDRFLAFIASPLPE